MATRNGQPNVSFLTTADSIGGMERIVCGLSREFHARNWNVQTVFPHTTKRDALLQWCTEQGVAATTHPSVLDAAAPHHVSDMIELRKFIRDSKPSVVNIHYGDNFMSLKDIAAIRAAGKHRLVVTVHHPTSWKDTNPRKRIMTALAASLADEVITVSKATYDVLRQAMIPEHKLHIIPCGIQVPKQTFAQQEARKRFNLPEDAFIIGSLARLVPHKGIDDLIRAVVRIPRVDQQILLVVAGDGPERARLEQLARELNCNVNFLGRVPEIDPFLASCDVFALPSHLEGFGLVYVEAAFHGVPSVGTNVGGVPDAVIDKKTGLLTNVRDVEAMTRALYQLFSDVDLRKQLGHAARQRAYTELTEAVMADRFERVFTKYAFNPGVRGQGSGVGA